MEAPTRGGLTVGLLAPMAFVGRSGMGRYQTELSKALARALSPDAELHLIVQMRLQGPLRGGARPGGMERVIVRDYMGPGAAVRELPRVLARLARAPDLLDWHPEALFSLVGSRILAARAAERARLDLVHGMANFLPRTRPKMARVVSLLDTIPLDRPQDVTRSTRLGYLRPNELLPDDRIITISAVAREGILRHFPAAEGRVHVVPLGVDRETFRPAPEPPAPTEGGYLLSVGMFEPRKNLARALEAFERVAARRPSVRWKLVGAPGFGRAQFEKRLAASPARGQVDLYGPADDAALADLYRGARALLFPSLAEGFGLPVVEALACGTPVAASDLPVVAEVADDVFARLDPADVVSIEEAIERAAFDETLRASLRKDGLERAQRFEWGRVAEEHLQVYAQALGAPVSELLVAPA
ncbi:MAG TPA: glycosyltransferase family 1 protein [Candidatus Thermoplasmatota archaeon]